MMKVGHVWRFTYKLDASWDWPFCITQKDGTRYSFPFAIGWMEESPDMVPDGEVPLRAFTCFIGPFALAIGFVSKKKASVK